MQFFSLPVRSGSKAVLSCYLHEVSRETPHRDTRPAMLVLPGGGYTMCSDREAEPFAMEWLVRGYNAFVLRYTVSDSAEPSYLEPLKDAAAAMDLLRKNAEEWHIFPDKIAAIGFSAGGHLCASLGVHWDDPRLHAVNARPDAMVLCYPVITTRSEVGSTRCAATKLANDEPEWLDYFALEEHARPDMPPAFLWTTYTDQLVNPEHSMRMASAMMKVGVPCELHMFDHGQHGYALANHETAAWTLTADAALAQWKTLAANWLNNQFGWQE